MRRPRLRFLLALAASLPLVALPLRHVDGQVVFSQPLNNATSSLAQGHAVGSDTLVLQSGHGSRFGTPSVDAPIRVTVARQSTLVGGQIVASTARTIFLVTARSGDTLSGLTATESTSDQAFTRNDPVAQVLTAGAIAEIQEAIQDKVDAADAVTLDDPQDVPSVKTLIEPTGTATAIAKFGRTSGGTQLLAQLQSKNDGIDPANNPDAIQQKLGRGTLRLWDWANTDGSLRGTPRGFVVGPFDFGVNFSAVNPGPGDCFEFASGAGGVGVRCNVPGQDSNIFEVRGIPDDDGFRMCYTTAGQNTTNDGSGDGGLAHSGMYGRGAYLYNRDDAGNGLIIHNFDGTGLRVADNGVVTVGFRLLRQNRMVAPMPAGTPSAALSAGFHVGSGVSTLDSTVALGYYNSEFNNEVLPWKIRRKGSDGGFEIVNNTSGSESSAGSLYSNTDGAWAIGTAADNAFKLKVNGALSSSSLTTGHIISTGTAPTLTAGTGAGTGPTISISGTDTAGTVTVTTGTGPVGFTNTVFRVTFATAYASAPRCVLVTPANANAAALPDSQEPWWNAATTDTTKFDVQAGSDALAATTQYRWAYQVTQ